MTASACRPMATLQLPCIALEDKRNIDHEWPERALAHAKVVRLKDVDPEIPGGAGLALRAASKLAVCVSQWLFPSTAAPLAIDGRVLSGFSGPLNTLKLAVNASTGGRSCPARMGIRLLLQLRTVRQV
jgi:hypothetical protein